MKATFEPIVGRYCHLELSGRPHRLYVEEAGSGIPLVCLHTAGADGRQFRHLLNELARRGKTILYISHVLEVVEKVCAHVVIIYKGRIMAADSVERLRDLMNAPSLEEIFSQLVEQRDLEAVARGIVSAIA